jgi:hypothetical protein
MLNSVGRFFRLRPGEYRLVLVMGLLLFANSLALEISDVVAISGFLENVGVPELLIVYIIDMLLIILTAGLQSLIVDRFHRTLLLRAMAIIIAVAYLLIRVLFIIGSPDWLNYSLLYLLSDQQWLFFPLIFWVLANDTFDMSQGKRLFPLISGVGFIGQIVGLVIAGAMPAVLSSANISSVELLVFNAGIYVLTFFVTLFGLRGIKVRATSHEHSPVRETLLEGWGFVREVPSFRFLMLAAFACAMVILILEYHFLVVSDASFTGASFQTFYSLYRIVGTVAAFLMQSFITGRVLERITLKNSFLVMPSVYAAASALMLGLPGIATATIGFVWARLAKQTINETASKSLLALVPEERRGRVSFFIDSYLYASGVIAGCVITGIIVLVGKLTGFTGYFYAYLGVAVLASLVAVWAILQMRKVYDISLFNWRLKRRQRGSKVVDKLNF